MVTAMDDVVGNVTESLKEAGLYENSVIIWFSDNGGPVSFGASNFPLRGTKEGFQFNFNEMSLNREERELELMGALWSLSK